MVERPELPEAAQWYYLRAGDSCGPIAASTLRQMVSSGEIPSDTLVWRDGMHDWLPASELGLTGRPATPAPPPVATPPTPPSSPGNKSAAQVPARGREGSRRRGKNSQLWAWGITGAVTLLLIAVVAGSQLIDRDSDSRRRQQRVTQATGQRQSPPRERTSENRSTAATRDDTLESSGIGDVPARDASDKVEGAVQPRVWPERTADSTGAKIDVPPASTPRGERPRILFQEIRIHRRPTFGVMGTSMAQDIQYAILTRLDRQPPLEDGSFRVLQEVLDTRLDRADAMSRSTYEKTLEKLVGAKYTYTLNSKCEVTRFDGFESGLSTLPVDMAGGSGFQMTQALDKDAWKEVLERSLLEPARHIAPGQPWTRQMAHDFSPLGRWSGTTTFTQDTSQGPPLLYFKYKHEMTFTPTEGGGAGLPFNVSDAKFNLVSATGTFVYDPNTQHVTEVVESFHVTGSIATELLGSAGSLEFQERQQWTIRLTTQNPWTSER